MKRGKQDNLGIISAFLHRNIHCDPSNEGSQCMFPFRNQKIISELLLLPLLIWGSDCDALRAFLEEIY